MILATRGQREVDGAAPSPVADEREAFQLRCQAQRAHLHALAFAAVCTALALAWGADL